jgi:hypothetical protein
MAALRQVSRIKLLPGRQLYSEIPTRTKVKFAKDRRKSSKTAELPPELNQDVKAPNPITLRIKAANS